MSQQIVTLEVDTRTNAAKSESSLVAERSTKEEIVVISGSITVSF